MAVLAAVVSDDVCRNLAGHDPGADYQSVVVAREAGASDLRVVHTRGWLPGHHTMATLAAIAAGDVRRCFARGGQTIVATQAIAGDSVMRKVCRLPRQCGVAVLTVVVRDDVCRNLAGHDPGADHQSVVVA